MSNNTNTHKNKKFNKQYKQMNNRTAYDSVVESKTVKAGCKLIKDMVVGIGSLLGAAVSDISSAVKSFSNNKKR